MFEKTSRQEERSLDSNYVLGSVTRLSTYTDLIYVPWDDKNLAKGYTPNMRKAAVEQRMNKQV